MPSTSTETTTATSLFDLPAHLAAKASPRRIAHDEAQLRRIREALEETVAATARELAAALSRTGPGAQGRVEREARVDHARRRLRGLAAVRLDAVLGRMTPADGGPPLHVGRLGVHAPDGRVLMIDWRTEAARPFFAATRAEPLGLASRRRYRWEGGRVRDYWDELLDEDAEDPRGEEPSPDEESALREMLGRARTPRMTSVLSTLAAEQDAIVRAPVRGPLVVDGGPGTGKTVVALHRAAYLLHEDPRLAGGRGRMLVVGPHRPYLHHIADVLPGLGEDGVLTCTLADMVPEGEDALPETDPEVAALKGSAALLGAIEPAVAMYEEPPREGHLLETSWGLLEIDAEDWEDAFAAAAGLPHDEAHGAILEELAEILCARLRAEHGHPVAPEEVLPVLERDPALLAVLRRAWPLLRAPDLLGDLYEVPAYLRRCAPSLTEAQVRSLQRAEPRAWTVADLPLLDALRHRLGDPEAAREQRRRRARQRDLLEETMLGLEEMIAADGSEMQVMSMLRGADLQEALADRAETVTAPPDRLAGPFAHIVVDEAQELDDAQWAMVLRRCPSRSLTLVGDPAQSARAEGTGWGERLERVGLDRVRIATLGLNYRTPAEIMMAAAALRAGRPDAVVPTSIRETGVPVRRGRCAQLPAVLRSWLDAHAEGTVAVLGSESVLAELEGTLREAGPRVRALTPALAKGLEVDLVVLVRPEDLGDGAAGAAARYVAMTRATAELVVLADAQ
jgi:DNA helicase IV